MKGFGPLPSVFSLNCLRPLPFLLHRYIRRPFIRRPCNIPISAFPLLLHLRRREIMLGKRPRPMQRSTSKMHLLPSDNTSSPLAFPSKHKPSLESPVPPRQVIGFNPVLRDLDVALPRPFPVSVTEIRSPRSGLESLLSSPLASEKKAGELEMLSGDVSKRHLEVVKLSIVNDEQHSVKQSEPIHISRNNSRPERRHSHELSFHFLSSLSFRSYNNPADVMEMELAHESIFSTASPASSCSDSCLLIDFLNSCFFCKRQLGHGKDIYMYRGDRAFCSMECRFQQIALDERKDRCATSVPSSMIKLRSRLHIASPAAAA